ncbi:C45 family autoproteolytic acyltransferase/hydrolase [Bacillus tianshenii]|nr:C45 family autoproteolytic acyltransferase/hydrolase [Bacillus tianshenii]
MSAIYLDVLQGRGSYYELGLLQGRLQKQSPLYENHRKRRKQSMRRYTAETEQVYELYQQFAPGLWEELRGLAEGLGWSLDETVHEYSGFQMDWKRSGCTVVIGDKYYIRNYDYHPKTYEGRLLLWQPESGYASIGPTQRMIGRIDGMNEKGLVMSYNFVNRRRAEPGFICCILSRIVLDTCADVDEAVETLQRLPHRHSFMYTLFDASGKHAIVEGSPRGVKVREGGLCTNHFELMPDENRYHLVESKRRMAELEKIDFSRHTAEEAFKIMNHTKHAIAATEFGNWDGTIHTTSYFPMAQQMWFALGVNAMNVKIDFERWVSGENIYLKRIKGSIPTDWLTPNMGMKS